MSTAQQIGPQLPIVVVPAYKRRTASTRLNWKRDGLEKVEYTPDNSRIGRESAGIQSKPDKDNEGTYQQVKAATLRRLLTAGAGYSLNRLAGVMPSTAAVVEVEREPEAQPVSKPIGCETRPGMLGSRDYSKADQFRTEYVRNPKPMKYQPVQSEAKESKTTWTPQQGQRPVVVRSR